MSGTHPGRRTRSLLRRAAVLLTALVALGLIGGPALAAWLTSGSGNTTVRASDLSTPRAPTVKPSGGNMAVVSWHATKLSTGQAATGYVVRRTDSSGTREVCSVSAPTLSCTDTTAIVKTASYTVAATFASWSSAQSKAKVYEGSAPKTTLSTDSSANSAGWWTSSPVGFTLNATDSASGVASITYQVGEASPVTVNAATTTFSVSAQGTTSITYTATDNVGNVAKQKSFKLELDSVAPATPTNLSSSPDDGVRDNDGISDSSTPTISGTAEAGSTVEVRIDGVLRWTVKAAANGTFTTPGGPAGYPPGTELTEGSHTLSVRAIDAAGNVGTAFAGTGFVDLTDPTVKVTSPTSRAMNNGQWGKGCSQEGMCGTASDSTGVWRVTYELKRKGTTSGSDACWNGTTFATAACGFDKMYATGTTAWSVPLAYASLPSGNFELRVRSVDIAGRKSLDALVTFSN